MQAMSTTMASFSPPTNFLATPSSSQHSKPHLLIHNKSFLTLRPRPRPRPKNTPLLLFSPLKASSDNGVGTSSSLAATTAVEPAPPGRAMSETPPPAVESSVGTNGSIDGAVAEEVKVVSGFVDPKWVRGAWDLKQFQKNGKTDWDDVIDAEARRRKWLEDYPESSSSENPIVFDTSIIPWWAWMKRFHLLEAEKLNVVGVISIRKNEDIETLKKLWEETTFYNKQWQATWQDENASASKKE